MIWKAKQKFSEEIITQLLAGRGIVDTEKFLDPKFEHSNDPFLLADMSKAVERIRLALENNEKITVYADYDADAVTAAAVLLRYFQHLNYKNADYYIPDRFTEGYGMNIDAIKVLAERGTKLIITVDCGINAYDAVDLAKELGMDVVITDHHQLTSDIPNGAAVVNPHRPGDEYPFKDLTGVGVAFKVAQGLQKSFDSAPLRSGNKLVPELVEGWEKWLLDLVAIGTVADCQSLLGENRIFVKWGMFVTQKTRWVGLRKLMEIAGLAKTALDTYKIGFIIAPRINAAGRIEHANLALELLLTDDEDEAETLADKLNELNRHRQELTSQILSEAREQVLIHKDKKVLLAQGDNWPKGIVGLVAGKLTEEFYRPVLVLSRNETEAVGSARSVSGFNIVEAISGSRDILLRFGGHAQAAGFTLHSEKIELFHKNLLAHAEAVLPEEFLSPVLHYDAEIKLADVTQELINTLEQFEPYGVGNPRPRFRMNNLEAKFIKKIGSEEKHLRMHVAGDLSPSLSPSSGERGSSEFPSPGDGEGLRERSSFGCIGFNLGFWADKLKEGDKIDIICEPQYNEWNGEKKIQLKIIDLDYSGTPVQPSISY